MEELTGTLSHVVLPLLLPALALLMGLCAERKGWRGLRATSPMPLDWFDRWWVLQTRLLQGSDAADRLRATLTDVAAVRMLGRAWLFAGSLMTITAAYWIVAGLTR